MEAEPKMANNNVKHVQTILPAEVWQKAQANGAKGKSAAEWLRALIQADTGLTWTVDTAKRTPQELVATRLAALVKAGQLPDHVLDTFPADIVRMVRARRAVE